MWRGVLAWAPLSTAWARADPRYRASWGAALRGELTVRERGDPRPLTYRYLGGEAALEVRLVREGGRWRVLAVAGNLR